MTKVSWAQFEQDFLAMPLPVAICLAGLFAFVVVTAFALRRSHLRRYSAIEAKYTALDARLQSLETYREREMLLRMRGPRASNDEVRQTA